MIHPVAALVGALAGAILGSFLATLILRWPQGRGVMRGRSACDSCGRTLGPRDLVPMLSALASRGQCRSCGARIDPLHGRVEAGCAIVGASARVRRDRSRADAERAQGVTAGQPRSTTV